MNSSELQPWTFLSPSSQSASSRTGSPTWSTSVRTTMAGNLCRVQLSTSRPICVPSLCFFLLSRTLCTNRRLCKCTTAQQMGINPRPAISFQKGTSGHSFHFCELTMNSLLPRNSYNLKGLATMRAASRNASCTNKSQSWRVHE
ncbi:hypothetical protein Mapa_016303 [Marchantia paleacea]|nr:hypothetical protein Mapa_016303 [Marchantia paleacea]